MISKAEIKNIRQLHQKKYREEQKLFIAEGPKVVQELFGSRYKAQAIFATEKYNLAGAEPVLQAVSEKELESISALTTPNQVVGVFEIPDAAMPPVSSFSKELVLALEDIRDPGNFGTLVRIADWFGIRYMVCSESCVDLYNPKVVQSAMGSMARVEVQYAGLDAFLSACKKENKTCPVYAAVMDGENIYSAKLSNAGIILIGNESKGISKDVLQQATGQITIPNFGKADSLNAAIAAGVICSEFRRRS